MTKSDQIKELRDKVAQLLDDEAEKARCEELTQQIECYERSAHSNSHILGLILGMRKVPDNADKTTVLESMYRALKNNSDFMQQYIAEFNIP